MDSAVKPRKDVKIEIETRPGFLKREGVEWGGNAGEELSGDCRVIVADTLDTRIPLLA